MTRVMNSMFLAFSAASRSTSGAGEDDNGSGVHGALGDTCAGAGVMIGGAFGGGRVGILDTGVVTPMGMGLVSGCFVCGFDGIGSAGCGGGSSWSRGRGPCGGGGGAGALGTTKDGGDGGVGSLVTACGGVEYD
jgi:hypothetical protein